MISDITIPFVEKHHRWSIGIFESRDGAQFYPAKGVPQPVLTARDVTDIKARFVADPFMIHKEDRWYLFFEVFSGVTKKGEIALAESTDAKKWSYRQVVLAEPFHLSYPFVFRSEGRFYLVPESGSQKAVRLYEAVDFPLKWRFVKNLVAGERFGDTTLFRHQDRWWMFTGTDPVNHDTLHLYFADDLTGEWTRHPLSPIVRGNPSNARPAGRVMSDGGRIVRFAQVDTPYYGKWTKAFEVITLSKGSYEEKEIAEFPFSRRMKKQGWNKDGMHHIDAHSTGPKEWLACVDGFRYVYYFGLRRKMKLKELWT